MRHPTIDSSRCNLCEGCVEMCPQVFKINEVMGHVEILELHCYPTQDVDEAINNCPLDCMSWEE